MGYKCVVPNCNAGYKTCTETLTMFKVPNEGDMLMKWQSAIKRGDREITPKDHVCERHFAPFHIITERKVELNGTVFASEPLKKKGSLMMQYLQYFQIVHHTCLPRSSPPEKENPGKLQALMYGKPKRQIIIIIIIYCKEKSTKYRHQRAINSI